MNFPALGYAATIALANVVSLVVGFAVHADEIEAPETQERVLLSDMFASLSQFDAEETDRFASRFGIRKGRGVQIVKPIEVKDRKYELNLSGPLVKTGAKKKNLGLLFELRF